MAIINDNMNEIIRKSAEVVPSQPDPTKLRIRTTSTGTFTPSGLTVEGKITVVELIDSAWRPLPATALTDRNAIAIQNQTSTEMKIQYDNTVGYVGVIIGAGAERYYDITEDIILYGRSASGTINIVVEEIA